MIRDILRWTGLIAAPIAMIGMIWWAYAQFGVDEVTLCTTVFAGTIALADVLRIFKVRE